MNPEVRLSIPSCFQPHVLDPTIDSRQCEAVLSRARLFETPTQAVIGTTSTGTIIHWSEAAESIYGWSATEALGRNILDITPTRMSRETAAEVMNHLRKGRSWSGKFLVQGHDGHEFWVYVRDLPILDERGELVGIVGISTPVARTQR